MQGVRAPSLLVCNLQTECKDLQLPHSVSAHGALPYTSLARTDQSLVGGEVPLFLGAVVVAEVSPLERVSGATRPIVVRLRTAALCEARRMFSCRHLHHQGEICHSCLYSAFAWSTEFCTRSLGGAEEPN